MPFDVVVVGAGPAGIAAAVRASEGGASVAMLDDNPAAGGQIWRGGESRWVRRFAAAKVEMATGARVIAGDAATRTLVVEREDSAREVRYRSLVLATGAREIFLPFPGWTLPGVMGAGGLQAMVKGGLPVKDRSVVVVGSGPLLMAVAAYLRARGARIKLIAEQATLQSLVPFVLEAMRDPAKAVQAAGLQWRLAGVPVAMGAWVEAAEGQERLERVRVRRGGSTSVLDCDYAAIGYGLYPNTELAALLGCRLDGRAVAVDDLQRTSVDGVLAAGECTGIGGAELSIVEGEIAGLAACGHEDEARRLFGKRAKARRFAGALDRAFALRDEVKRLPDDETIFCRCEDVPYSRVRDFESFRAAKLHTRCGMGACQGRVCGTAGDVLFGWRNESVRPPVFPARIASLALSENSETE